MILNCLHIYMYIKKHSRSAIVHLKFKNKTKIFQLKLNLVYL